MPRPEIITAGNPLPFGPVFIGFALVAGFLVIGGLEAYIRPKRRYPFLADYDKPTQPSERDGPAVFEP